jgi:hypothetical protein
VFPARKRRDLRGTYAICFQPKDNSL